MINSSADAGIPLLTEILVSPPGEPTFTKADDAALAVSPAEFKASAGEVKKDSTHVAASAATTIAAASAIASPGMPFSDLHFAADFTPAAAPAPSMTLAARTAPTLKFGTPDLSVDFDIPELLVPVSEAPVPTSFAAPPFASPLFATPAFSAPSVARHTISSAEWEQLEADITERISRQVLSRIDFVLEQRVRDSLADVLQIAVEGLAQEIKRGLHQTLEDVIGRAVAQEIARLQTSKN